MKKSIDQTEAFQEGYHSAKTLHIIDVNSPYPLGTLQHLSWLIGYINRVREFQIEIERELLQ